jgi:serine/threonine-protein kinase HipA
MVAALELKELLHGESSEDVFLDLLSEYAASGVSGVVPKFLTPETRAIFRKGSIATERHIVKGSSAKQPFIALNEHLCMEAARRTGFDAARTQVSDDGRVLVVERFDIDPLTLQRFGFEDCCSLLGLDPDKKYDSTWERVARLTREWVPPTLLVHSREQMAVTLLLTMALGNADCHSKNVAFMYSGLDDIRVAPVYDMLTTLAYDQYADNPPGMYIDGRKSWNPDKALWRFLQQHLGVEPPRQRELVDLVCQSVSSVVPELIQRTRHIEGFADVARAMLWQWNAGIKRLTNRRTVVVPDFVDAAVAAGLACPVAPLKYAPKRIGESELLAPRGKRRVRPAS